MNNQFLETMLASIEKISRKVVWNELKTNGYVRKSLARIVSIDESSYTVRLLTNPDDGSQDFDVANPFGFPLTVNDYVWLDSWGNPANYYISLKQE